MSILQRLPKTNYQDLLRSLGYFLDQEGLTSVRIVETEKGIILQGSPPRGRGEPKVESYFLSVSDLRRLLLAAYARRRVKL